MSGPDVAVGQLRLPRRYVVAAAVFVVLVIATEVLLANSFTRLGRSAGEYNAGTRAITLMADMQRGTLKLRQAVVEHGRLDHPDVIVERGLLGRQMTTATNSLDELEQLRPGSSELFLPYVDGLGHFDDLAAEDPTQVTEALVVLDGLDRAAKRAASRIEVEYVDSLFEVERRTANVRNVIVAATLVTLALGAAVAFAATRRYRRAYAGAYEQLRQEVGIRKEREEQLEQQAQTLVAWSAELEAANEALRLADANKNDFVSTVSHELRTPLTAMRGFAQTLLGRWEELEDEQRRHLVTSIERQGGRQQRLIDDLLTVSRMIAGTLQARPQPVELRSAVLSAVEVVDTEVELDVPEDLVVFVDRDHLAQVVTNLLTNAVKYGRPPVSVRAQVVAEQVEVVVRDRGDGVPEEFRSRLFERFEQGSERRTGGLGLGLAISRELCELNGGSLEYRDLGEGACFAASLPRHAGGGSVATEPYARGQERRA